MEPLLYLVHRMPYPPDKGDRLRSYHLLRFLAKRFRVHLGTFADGKPDAAHVAALLPLCASIHVVTLRPLRARLRSLAGLVTGEPLTLRYYRHAALGKWVRRTVREQAINQAVVFSSAMAQYVTGLRAVRTVVDFVDVDSAKWTEYGRTRRWPAAGIYRREGRRLLDYERLVAQRAAASVFVTRAEADLFCAHAPESAARVTTAQNGVDTDYFAPDAGLPSPFAADEEAIVFTGAMDYWPNVDAVRWFAAEVLPVVAAVRPGARFWIVGMQPAAAVTALARDPRVTVTGRVPDVRPFLQHARVVVAPLRVARGIQNKVLEALAMARPVVVSAPIAASLGAVPDGALDVADTAAQFAERVERVLSGRAGQVDGAAARRYVLGAYAWSANLAPFGALLDHGPVPHGRGRSPEPASYACTPNRT